MRSVVSLLDQAAAQFRWALFRPTAEASALALAVFSISAAILIEKSSFGVAIARMQLCATLYAPTPAGALRQSATLLKHLFVHTDWLHLIGNVAFLLLLGSAVSRRLAAGAAFEKPLRALAAFCAFFLACGVAGGVVFVLMDRFAPSCTIGASGAIAGFLGATMRFAFRGETAARVDPFGFEPWSRRMRTAIAAIIVANAALSAAGVLLRAPALITAWQAHAGGLVFGALVFPWFARLAR